MTNQIAPEESGQSARYATVGAARISPDRSRFTPSADAFRVTEEIVEVVGNHTLKVGANWHIDQFAGESEIKSPGGDGDDSSGFYVVLSGGR